MTSTDKKREIFGLFYLAAAIFLAVIFYLPASKTGWLGSFLFGGGLGLFGTAAYVLPAIFLYMSLDYFFGAKLTITRQRFTAVLLLWLSVAVLTALLTISQDQLREAVNIGDNSGARGAIAYLWDYGKETYSAEGGVVFGGGLVGGLIAAAIRSLIGQIGALIFVIVMILALLVLIFNLSVSRVIHHTASKISETQSRVSDVVKRQVTDIKQHRELRQNAPQVRRIEGADYDLQLPTSWQSADKSGRKKKSFRPDSDYDNDNDNDNETIDNSTVDAAEATKSEDREDIWQNNGWMKLPEHDPLFVDENDSSLASLDEHDPGLAYSGDSIIKDVYDEHDKTEESVQFIKLDEQALPYTPPSLNLLKDDANQRRVQMHAGAIRALGRKLEQTLESFKVQAKVVNFTTGPTITRFELTPGPGVKVSKIVNLADDIALNLAAMGVRIEAPIPGKAAIGIEIPNKETTPVLLRGLLEAPEFIQAKSPLTAALGRDVQGNPIYCDIAKMPHLLIAGATGSGKSVCINCILMSLLYKATPAQVRMLMIDPKVVELSVYNGIPHLIQPVVTDPKKAYGALNWAVDEMTRRYGLFAERSVRDVTSYNAALDLDQEEESEKLPLILLVIDELSDLMATTPNEVEDAIARLTAMARAAGIHLIIATQRPSVDVITGVIKANIPSRIAFAVASQIDSRTIIDMGGAEKLLGKGDMLYAPQSASKPVRGQGAFVTDAEVENVLQNIKNQHTPDYDEEVAQAIAAVPLAKGKNSKEEKETASPGEQDELLPQALGIVVETGYASVSLLQRRMTIGYPRAARLIDRLHEMGYVGPFEGSKPRKVLLSMAQYMELQQQEESDT
ncbi:MAG: DNA translocase FtsK [Eubacteriales bacterium]|nr:DNA translocase FtsK [Eubacteriales bacterium]